MDRSEYPLEGLCHPLSQALFCLFPGAFAAWYVEGEEEMATCFCAMRRGRSLI
jgi:hypothetical protein